VVPPQRLRHHGNQYHQCEDFFEGLGFSPAISLNMDGLALRREIESYGLRVSQLDCHYALHAGNRFPT